MNEHNLIVIDNFKTIVGNRIHEVLEKVDNAADLTFKIIIKNGIVTGFVVGEIEYLTPFGG